VKWKPFVSEKQFIEIKICWLLRGTMAYPSETERERENFSLNNCVYCVIKAMSLKHENPFGIFCSVFIFPSAKRLRKKEPKEFFFFSHKSAYIAILIQGTLSLSFSVSRKPSTRCQICVVLCHKFVLSLFFFVVPLALSLSLTVEIYSCIHLYANVASLFLLLANLGRKKKRK
jgi:hypothetical protein